MKGKSYEKKRQKNYVLNVCRCFYVRNGFCCFCGGIISDKFQSQRNKQHDTDIRDVVGSDDFR